MQPVSRKQALEQGLSRYFTGRPCKQGHVAERRVNGRCCIVCADETARKWAENHPERTKRIATEWALRNKTQEAARAVRWRKENPDAYKKTISRWRANNADQYRAYMVKAVSDRRAAKIMREPKWVDKERVSAYYDVCAFFNRVNGYTKYHVDHIIPLKGTLVSGLHVHSNLQIILATDNRAKGNFFEVL